MKEIWKDIPGYEGLYQASSFGRIKLSAGAYDMACAPLRKLKKGENNDK